MQAFALIDFDNLCTIPRSAADHVYEIEIDRFLNYFAKQFRLYLGQPNDLVVRMYGGWRAVDGQFTETANRLLRILPRASSRREGMRVSAKLALATLKRPDCELIGTYRREGDDTRQKMVDAMISCDLIYLASETNCPVLLGSDDEDMLPAVLLVDASRPFMVIRRRTKDCWLNEKHLGAHVILRTLDLN